MVKNKKKSPGRPKKEFISTKPKTKIQTWPGRPRKEQHDVHSHTKVSPTIKGFVEHALDDSKKKDLIILLLFLLSFLLFLVSIYFTFIKQKQPTEVTPAELAEITNIQTGDIAYTQTNQVDSLTSVQSTLTTNPQYQVILDFYQAVNTIDIDTIRTIAEGHLETSNVFKTYYSQNRLTKFLQTILAPKLVVSNIQEIPTNSPNPNVKNFTYTLEYILAQNQQKFTEERSTVLIYKNDAWKIGKLMCETKWCSTMPFFNPDKYK